MPGLAQVSAARMDEYLDAATWQPRRWVGIDPLKEANANEVNLRLGLTSRRRLILERGEDPDEIAAELALEPPVPAAANTPAPLDPSSDPNATDTTDTTAPARHLRAVRSLEIPE